MRKTSLALTLVTLIIACIVLTSQATAMPQSRPDAKPPKGETSLPDPAIAYAALRSDRTDLVVMNADGSNQRILFSQSGVANREPDWSPDASQLVFVSDVQGPGIYTINRDGSGLCKVGPTSARIHVNPAWSPAPLGQHGYKVAYSDFVGGTLHLFLVSPSCPGGAPFNLSASSGFQGGFFPTWSPTADRLALQVEDETGGTDIVAYDLSFVPEVAITGQTILTAVGPLSTRFATRPAWARSQEKIVVDAGALAHDIWVIDLLDPDNPTRLTNTAEVDETMPTWSSDDSQIAFRRDDHNRGKGRLGIYRMQANGTGLTQLTGTAQSVLDLSNPDWRRCCPSCELPCAP